MSSYGESDSDFSFGRDSGNDSQAHELAEGRSANDIQSQIWQALSKLEVPSAFTAGDHLTAAPNPGLSIHGHGTIGLPLSEHDAEAIISTSKLSSCGNREQSLVDTTSHKSWELHAPDVTFGNPEWKNEIGRYVSSVYTALGLTCGRENIIAKFDNLSLCERGAFFKARKDGEKVPGMFATLIVCLPSAHEGGTLVLQHGLEVHEFVTSSTSSFGISWATWYSDITHNVTPVISGRRVVLTYNLVRRSGGGHSLVSPSLGSYKTKLSMLLRAYNERLENGEDLPEFLIQKLKHKYTHTSLRHEALKGPDAAQLQALIEVTRHIGYKLYLATFEVQLVKDVDEEEPDRSEALKNVVELNGSLVATNLTTPDYAVLDPQQEDEDGYDEVQQEHSDELERAYGGGYTGGATTLWYRDAAIVIIPPSGYAKFVTLSGLPRSRTLSVLRELKAQSHVDPAVELVQQRQIAKICRLILSECPLPRVEYVSADGGEPRQLFNEAAATALEAHDIATFETACKRTYGRIAVDIAEVVGKVLAQVGLTRMKSVLEQAAKVPLTLENQRNLLGKLEKGIQLCASPMPETDLDAFRQWSSDKIVEMAFRSKEPRREAGMVLAQVSEILDWPTFEDTAKNQLMVSTKKMQIVFVNEFLHRHSYQLDEAQRDFIDEIIEQVWESFRFPIAPPSTAPKVSSLLPGHYEGDTYGIVSTRPYNSGPSKPQPLDLLAGEDLSEFLQNSVSQSSFMKFESDIAPRLQMAILEATPEVCSSTFLPFIKIVLDNKCEPFQLEPSKPLPTHVQKILVQSFIAIYISQVIGFKPSKPKDWSMPRADCVCPDCNKVNAFLADPVRQQLDFPCNKSRRDHLMQTFEYSRPHQSYTIKELVGNPYNWRMVKNNSEFERLQRGWEEARTQLLTVLLSLTEVGSVATRLKAYLSPHYKAFMEATSEKLPKIDNLQPIKEINGNARLEGRQSRKRGRPSSSTKAEDASSKKLRRETGLDDAADENTPTEVEVVDLT